MTHHIHINGIVQGVGFRPMVYQLAGDMQLEGYVKNWSDGVHVFFNATVDKADLFFKKIMQNAPAQSKIILSQLNRTEDAVFSGFSIVVNENDNDAKQVLMSPDTAICAACRNELHDINGRRYRYPFITCTHCGPRYSIISNLPYERHGTAMRNFHMCEACDHEYHNVADRRFFSQTNSCANCGIELRNWENASSTLSNSSEEVLAYVKTFLEQGKILAVKGIGGYLLLCDANDAESIRLLRRRKHRPAKPFAILYPGIQRVGEDFDLNDQEKKLLQAGESPIVLLYPKKDAVHHLAVKSIAPGLDRLGIMLPCSPLLELIANDYGRPLIATSANISGSPIIYKDEDALSFLFDIADHVISYDRDIVIPQDDSVVQVSKYTNQQIFQRRSRGYAPSFLQYKPQTASAVLSTGAFLKSSFSLAVNGNVFVSQFLGSGERYESQQMYKDTLDHWLRLYAVKPAIVIADMHPNYFSHQYAVELAEKYGTDLRLVQHHEAHFAAALAENNLMHLKEPVLGIIWDGAGFGSDGNIWGGEFFKYENKSMLRCYYFDYFPAIAGDKFAMEPRIAALCVSNDTWPQPAALKDKFSEAEWNNYQALISATSLFSSSVGRIFDAVASLLDLCDKQTYEGEAAMYVQSYAEEYIKEKGFVMDDSYFKEGSHYYRIPTASLIQGIILDIKKGRAKHYIAAKFHYSLICLIDIVAKNLQVEKICFSGGVFQNALLTDWIQIACKDKYQLYFHKNLPPNDENISFGQLVYHDNNIKTVNKQHLNKQQKEMSTLSNNQNY